LFVDLGNDAKKIEDWNTLLVLTGKNAGKGASKNTRLSQSMRL
jgi:hypothetical protein